MTKRAEVQPLTASESRSEIHARAEAHYAYAHQDAPCKLPECAISMFVEGYRQGVADSPDSPTADELRKMARYSDAITFEAKLEKEILAGVSIDELGSRYGGSAYSLRVVRTILADKNATITALQSEVGRLRGIEERAKARNTWLENENARLNAQTVTVLPDEAEFKRLSAIESRAQELYNDTTWSKDSRWLKYVLEGEQP